MHFIHMSILASTCPRKEQLVMTNKTHFLRNSFLFHSRDSAFRSARTCPRVHVPKNHGMRGMHNFVHKIPFLCTSFCSSMLIVLCAYTSRKMFMQKRNIFNLLFNRLLKRFCDSISFICNMYYTNTKLASDLFLTSDSQCRN